MRELKKKKMAQNVFVHADFAIHYNANSKSEMKVIKGRVCSK